MSDGLFAGSAIYYGIGLACALVVCLEQAECCTGPRWALPKAAAVVVGAWLWLPAVVVWFVIAFAKNDWHWTERVEAIPSTPQEENR